MGSNLSLSPLFNSNGLVGYWKFDETSGATSTDSSGNGNNGTLVNGPSWVSGKVGGALSFNGTTQYVSVADNTSLNLTNAITISFWLYQTSNYAPDGYIVTIYKNDMNGYMPRINNGTFDVAMAGNYHRNSGGAARLNTWLLGTITYDGTTITNYINGVAVASSSFFATINASGSALIIGSRGGSTEFYTGLIDDIRIYSRALSAAEIMALYNATN